MSATRNEESTNAVVGQGGEFHSKIPPSEPLTTSGHKPGVIASKADAAPEFQAETLPAGTAPSSRTFQPQNDAVDPESVRQNAQDSLPGATSADVGAGVISGQSSAELHHDGQHHRKRERDGLVGVGANTHDAQLEKQRATE